MNGCKLRATCILLLAQPKYKFGLMRSLNLKLTEKGKMPIFQVCLMVSELSVFGLTVFQDRVYGRIMCT